MFDYILLKLFDAQALPTLLGGMWAQPTDINNAVLATYLFTGS